MSITIKELAAMLDVSIATVSMALNGSDRVADATRQRIMRTAEACGYVPNNFGRSLRTRRSRILGCLTGSITSSFFSSLLEGIHRECEAHEYGLLTCFCPGLSGEAIKRQLTLMVQRSVDGIIFLCDPGEDGQWRTLLERHRIPFVFCSVYDGDEYAKVLIDNEHAGFMALDHLMEVGHRAFLCCDRDPRRFRGNAQAASRNPACRIIPFDCDNAAILELLRANPDVTAITTYSDDHAIELMRDLRAAGIRVPEDISIVGFDDMPCAAWPEFSLTTVAQPKIEMGSEAVRNVLNQMENPSAPMERTILPVDIVPRNSVKRIEVNT